MKQRISNIVILKSIHRLKNLAKRVVIYSELKQQVLDPSTLLGMTTGKEDAAVVEAFVYKKTQ